MVYCEPVGLQAGQDVRGPLRVMAIVCSELHREVAVGGDHRPAVRQQDPFVTASLIIRLDGERHAGNQTWAGSGWRMWKRTDSRGGCARCRGRPPLMYDRDALGVGVAPFDGPADVIEVDLSYWAAWIPTCRAFATDG